VTAFLSTVALGAPAFAQAAVPPPAPAPGVETVQPTPLQPVAPVPVYVQPGYPQPGYAPGPPPPGYAPVYPQPGVVYPSGYPQPVYVSPRARPMGMNPDDPPPGYHTESRARMGLVVAGAVMLAIPYVLSVTAAVSASAGNDSGYSPLFVPVAGPFIALSTTHALVGTSDGLQEVGRVFGSIGLILDGILQVSGASLLLVGLVARHDVVVRDAPPERAGATAMPEVSLGLGGATARWSF
jgi:hypothetical protein